jgi:UDP-2,3-diacylglucosamine hydrolase
MSTLFISDLHLDPQRPAITALFLRFLEREARDADALYLLGDVFEAWVGDDDDGELPATVARALREVRETGVALGLIRGNRDFLLGHDYAERAGVALLPDPCVIDLHGEATLVLHGDLLCSADLKYLAFRRQVRDPAWQANFLSQPLAARQAFAAQARAASRAAQQAQSLDIGDAVEADVRDMLERFGVRRMIHGHTHRPRVHDYDYAIGDRHAQRIVLGDWYEQGSVLRVDARDRFALAQLPLPRAG